MVQTLWTHQVTVDTITGVCILTPQFFIPLYEYTMSTEYNADKLEPVWSEGVTATCSLNTTGSLDWKSFIWGTIQVDHEKTFCYSCMCKPVPLRKSGQKNDLELLKYTRTITQIYQQEFDINTRNTEPFNCSRLCFVKLEWGKWLSQNSTCMYSKWQLINESRHL